MTRTKRPVLEICVDEPAGVVAAIAGGANRLELCSALAVGGLTPTATFVTHGMRLARERGVAVHAMVRPRTGNFTYSDAEVGLVIDETLALIELGVDGLVFGAVRDDRLDILTIERWLAAVRPAPRSVDLTLHRAIDVVADPVGAVAVAAELGFDRILTAGGAAKALDGLATIARMVTRAADGPVIMAGSGVRAGDVSNLFAAGVREFHASAAGALPDHDRRLATAGFTSQRVTDQATVAALRTALDREREIAR